MEVYQQIDAVWCGAEPEEKNSTLKITIDVSNKKRTLQQFDLFTITKLAIRYRESKIMYYEYTRLHKRVTGNQIQFDVRVYGSPEDLIIQNCITKGYYVCREG